MVADLHSRTPARAGELAALRRELAYWCASAGLSDQAARDVVLAGYEAMANVVDHAYGTDPGASPRTLELHATDSDRSGVTVTVTDFGHWRPLPTDPGVRGRGLLLINQLTTRTQINADHSGTYVRMWWSERTLAGSATWDS